MDEIQKNIEEYCPNKERKILMVSSKKCNPVVSELFIWGRKLIVSFVFLAQPYFAVPKILH